MSLLAFTSVVAAIVTTPQMPGKSHIIEKVHKGMDYHCSISPYGIRIIIFVFFPRELVRYSRIINRWRVYRDSVKSYNEGNNNDIQWVS
jgi:hypothetical protein